VALATFGSVAGEAATLVTTGTSGTDGVTALYPTLLAGNTTGFSVDPILGAPNSNDGSIPSSSRYLGLGGRSVTYDFGDYRIVNGAGADFNLYEHGFGDPEFHLIDVLVSTNNIDFFSVKTSEGPRINLAGDERHAGTATTSDNFERSYDLAVLSGPLAFSLFRYLRIDGLSTLEGGIAGADRGFDLDAVGVANFAAVPGPIAGAGLPVLVALGGFVWARRRKAAATV
jgi:hypothetical protein